MVKYKLVSCLKKHGLKWHKTINNYFNPFFSQSDQTSKMIEIFLTKRLLVSTNDYKRKTQNKSIKNTNESMFSKHNNAKIFLNKIIQLDIFVKSQIKNDPLYTAPL